MCVCVCACACVCVHARVLSCAWHVCNTRYMTESINLKAQERDRGREQEIKTDRLQAARKKPGKGRQWKEKVQVRTFACTGRFLSVRLAWPFVDHPDTCLSISVILMSLWKFCRLVQHPSPQRAYPSQQNACNINRQYSPKPFMLKYYRDRGRAEIIHSKGWRWEGWRELRVCLFSQRTQQKASV